MHVDLMWLMVALLTFPLITLCDKLNVLLAPNILHVGTDEKVFTEVQDYSGNDLLVKISVKNYPQKRIEMTSATTNLTAENNYQSLVKIKIPDDKGFFSDDPLEKQYVFLQAQFPSSLLEKVVMVSFQSGYIFVQTDKAIYTPGATVLYRIFSLTPDLKPVDYRGELNVDIVNPHGFTISREAIHPKKGTVKGEYRIPELAKFGTWSILVQYKNNPQKNFTAQFEVKEYMLPSFEVLLKPSKPFIYVDDEKIEVEITAKYLFGNNVDGVAFVVFEVRKDDRKIPLPRSLSRTSITNGVGRVVLTRSTIQQSINNIDDLVGGTLFISASVLTQTGSELVEAEKGGIQFVKSPYTIEFERTPKYFQPGMPFEVTVHVTTPDQSPAENVDVVIRAGQEQGVVRARTMSNGIANVTVDTDRSWKTLEISASTDVPGILSERQSENKMKADAYTTKGDSGNYLHINADSAEVEINNETKFELNVQSSVQDQDLTYLITSKGQIVKASRLKRKGQSLIILSERITNDLIPSFRLVVYYHIGSEVVSDSIWVDVKDRCMGTLKLDVMQRLKKVFQPGENFNLVVIGDPNAEVGLIAVDKRAFVLNKNRLTQHQIWNLIEKYDTGCTAGSGKDSMGVFYDAGLLFQSDKAGGTKERTDTHCPSLPKKRIRRELQITQTLVGQFDSDLKKCCADGIRPTRLGYTCEKRSRFIVESSECVKTFLHCCMEIQSHKDEQQHLVRLARSDDDDNFINSDEIFTRKDFSESWLWEDINLPACPRNTPCTTTSVSMDTNYLKESITTWQILAISLSKTHGICVADPYEITVANPFFVDLKLPYSAVRKEQVEIKAIIHNFSNKQQKVQVVFFETEHICSVANNKKKYRTTVIVDPESSRSVPFLIIPMKTGEHHIEVHAASMYYSDGVRKTLKVVPEGVITELLVSNLELNPSQFPDGIQTVQMKTDFPSGQVPNTPAYSQISVTAGQEVSQTIEQVISGDFMGRLIINPTGNGDQVMIHMTLPLIATHYLDITNQWESVGLHRRNEAIKHITTGYVQELMFRKADGSYASFLSRPSSTWLTAYVAKVFAMASDYKNIEENVLCSALMWLIQNAQMSVGMFREKAPVVHSEMAGNVRGKDSDASLTAFVLITLQEGSHLCASSSLRESSNKALNYLERRLPSLTNPYAIAMTSYALANAGKFNKDRLLQVSSEDGSYWQVPGGLYFSVEATAYALLALVKAKEFDAAGKAVRWLNRQSIPYGGFGTTQATIMVFQAMAEYYKQVKGQQITNLDVEVKASGRSHPIKWSFNSRNSHLTRSDKVQLKQEFNVTAKGNCSGVLNVMTIYYARPTEKNVDCKRFTVSVEMKKEAKTSYSNAEESYELTIHVRFNDLSRDATMTILEIGLLTGFVVDKRDLTKLINGNDKYIHKFEIYSELSERGSLVIYLNKVSQKVPDTIAFRIHKMNRVNMHQPAAISVYEYYSPGERCVKFYHPTKKEGSINILCSNQKDLCTCAEGSCIIQKKPIIKHNDCELIDYVYKAKVVEMTLNPNTDFYQMEIQKIFREGIDPVKPGNRSIFMGHANCRGVFSFVKGKSYLLIGQGSKLLEEDNRWLYTLGEQTWTEYWPTSDEGQSDKYR